MAMRREIAKGRIKNMFLMWCKSLEGQKNKKEVQRRMERRFSKAFKEIEHFAERKVLDKKIGGEKVKK